MTESLQWPSLPLAEWQDTYRTLHRWTQIVGKVRMTLCPTLNHWWNVALYVNSHGLTTGPMPYQDGLLEIDFNFRDHTLQFRSSEGGTMERPLKAESVASFYHGVVEALASLGITVAINTKPQEVADPVPFDRDEANHSYDPEYANRFWRILQSSAKVMEQFRARFIGKCSPVHFFWGSFDLACTRFSGRRAPPRKGAISGPAYSHEVCSVGFWPGGGGVDGPAYYSYTIPQPAGMEKAMVQPGTAGWNSQLSEFLLMYEDVRQASSPEKALYAFLESTYKAGSRLGNWDYTNLEA